MSDSCMNDNGATRLSVAMARYKVEIHSNVGEEYAKNITIVSLLLFIFST